MRDIFTGLIIADGLHRARTLSKQAQDAGLVVTRMTPRLHHGRWEFDITLWMRDGSLWAEGTHETIDSVLRHIANAQAGDGYQPLPDVDGDA